VSNVLPVAAIVAICLFVLKEIFELLRRAGERKRKRAAIKELLRHEVEENYRVLNNLFHAIDSTTRTEILSDEKDTIVVQHSGQREYARVNKEGLVVSGNPLPPVCTAEFNRLLPLAAELDRRLYSDIRLGYEYVHRLDQLLNLFVDFLTGRPAEREMFLEAFRQYAWSDYDDIDAGLRRLYVGLAGHEIEYKGLKRNPGLPESSTSEVAQK
jgi:hypothetical protein